VFGQGVTAILDGVGARRHGLKQVGTKKRRSPVEPRNEFEGSGSSFRLRDRKTSISDSA
jgi:hypothetical protein